MTVYSSIWGTSSGPHPLILLQPRQQHNMLVYSHSSYIIIIIDILTYYLPHNIDAHSYHGHDPALTLKSRRHACVRMALPHLCHSQKRSQSWISEIHQGKPSTISSSRNAGVERLTVLPASLSRGGSWSWAFKINIKGDAEVIYSFQIRYPHGFYIWYPKLLPRLSPPPDTRGWFIIQPYVVSWGEHNGKTVSRLDKNWPRYKFRHHPNWDSCHVMLFLVHFEGCCCPKAFPKHLEATFRVPHHILGV